MSIRSGVSSASSEADDHADDEPITRSLTSQAGGLGLVSLDEVILEDVFSVRARFMETVPKFLREAYRAAVRVALDGVLARERGRLRPFSTSANFDFGQFLDVEFLEYKA